MRRTLLLVVCLLCSAGMVVSAAESPLVAAAAQARVQAEVDLASERLRLVDARAKRASEITEATRKLAEIRARIVGVESETGRLRTELERMRQNGSGNDVVVLQQLGRVAAFLHLDALPTQLKERAVAVAAALMAAPDRLVSQARVTLTEEQVQDRSGQSVTVPVLRIGTGRAVACGDGPGTRGVVTVQNGLQLIAGPPLPLEADRAIGDPAQIVLDVAGTWAQQVLPPHRTLLDWLRGGRLFIWPILAVGFCGAVIAGLRAYALAKLPPRREQLDAVLAWMAGERAQPAPLPLISSTPLERLLTLGVATLKQPLAQREAALDQAVLAEAPRLQRGLNLVLLLASIAPLLGLLGTVTGMIDLFAVIGAQGSGNARALSGGISEALITTQAGMLVAVPLLVAHSLLNRAAERRIVLLEEAASGILGASGDRP